MLLKVSFDNLVALVYHALAKKSTDLHQTGIFCIKRERSSINVKKIGIFSSVKGMTLLQKNPISVIMLAYTN